MGIRITAGYTAEMSLDSGAEIICVAGAREFALL